MKLFTPNSRNQLHFPPLRVESDMPSDCGILFNMKKYNSDLFQFDHAYQFGKAGEHLVCADLLLKGYNAFLSPDSTGKYDVLLEVDGGLFKVQVKTTMAPRYNYRLKEKTKDINNKPVYAFNVYNCGYRRGNIYTEANIDIFALVAIDTKHIAYIPFTARTGNVLLRCPQFRGEYSNEKGISLYPKIQELMKEGHTCKEICTRLQIHHWTYYFYKKGARENHGLYAGSYIDNFPIEKCLDFINENKSNVKDAQMLKRYFHPLLFQKYA